ncbi:hypothetical protein WDU94_001631 [Cyamophila willieti]
MRSAISNLGNRFRSLCGGRDLSVIQNMPCSSNPDDFVEKVVCKKDEIPENGMKEVEIGWEDEKVLLVKQKGNIYAVGTKCSHYGAPLVKGSLGDGRVRCPWHGACFNITTGDIEDFPGMDSIPCYKVTVQEDDSVVVQARKDELKNKKRKLPMSKHICENQETYVVVGGGPSGAICVETLRQNGFNGKLFFVTDENFLPYDRVKLSKQLDVKAESILLRSEEFYKENDICMIKGKKMIGDSELKEKKIVLQDGTSIDFTKIYLATGSSPRTINQAHDVGNVFYLRTVEDANKIAPHINAESNVVVVGSSFIGMEAAAFCASKVKSVTVVGRGAVPFQESLGKEVGERITKLFESKGVKFVMKANVSTFDKDDACNVKAVNLDNSTTLPADLVIVGIGTVLNTNYLDGKGVELNGQKAVMVNEYLQTNLPHVYAGGDIAYAPLHSFYNKNASIGHYQLAQYHGRIAALNMVEKKTPLETIPFFWTMLFGVGFRFAGYAAGHTEVEIVGDLEALKFVAYYSNADKVLAILTVGMDPLAAQFAEHIKMGKYIQKNQIENNAWAAA